MMENRATLLLLVLVLCYGVTMSMGLYRKGNDDDDPGKERPEPPEEQKEGDDRFLLQDSKHVVKTDAGDMRVVRNFGIRMLEKPMHIGFITMEPKSLFIPQYLDSNLIIFIRRGEAKIGLVYKNELAERRLKGGDIYRIPAGSAFYLVNTAEGQRLHVICSIDPSQGLGFEPFQSFFIGGGTYPRSIFAGFELKTLATAFNVTSEEVREVITKQNDGPIIYLNDSRAPWSKYFLMKEKDRLKHMKRMMIFENQPTAEEKKEEVTSFSWRKLLHYVLGREDEKTRGKQTSKSPDSYNIYKKSPDFKNNYGYSIALDENDYEPLKNSGIGVYFVSLNAGSMMAPHLNPTATEYAIVLNGTGEIEIVYPNGTQAMKAKVEENKVFWIPRYFPFCQIASRTGTFEFVGFTTSAERNRPQFLAGASSILTTLRGPELAAAFGMPEKRVRDLINAQREAVILPSASAAPPDETVKKKTDSDQRVPTAMMKKIANDMILGFD